MAAVAYPPARLPQQVAPRHAEEPLRVAARLSLLARRRLHSTGSVLGPASTDMTACAPTAAALVPRCASAGASPRACASFDADANPPSRGGDSGTESAGASSSDGGGVDVSRGGAGGASSGSGGVCSSAPLVGSGGSVLNCGGGGSGRDRRCCGGSAAVPRGEAAGGTASAATSPAPPSETSPTPPSPSGRPLGAGVRGGAGVSFASTSGAAAALAAAAGAGAPAANATAAVATRAATASRRAGGGPRGGGGRARPLAAVTALPGAASATPEAVRRHTQSEHSYPALQYQSSRNTNQVTIGWRKTRCHS